jgi:hypothetical protein
VLAVHLQALDARDVTVSECGRHTRAWLIDEAHLSPEDAGRRLAVARLSRSSPGSAALLAGEITHEHARVMIGCLLKLDPSWREAAEAELLTFARDHDPAMLGALCRELRVRTGADEDAEAAAQRRYDSRWATSSKTFDGMLPQKRCSTRNQPLP